MVQNIMYSFPVDAQTIYMYMLIVAGALTLLYLLFGDVFHVAPGSILNPAVILSFFAILGGAGFVLELMTQMDDRTVIIIATLVATILVSFIHFSILVPLSKAEENSAFSLQDLVGKTGEVLTAIPSKGLGEVVLKAGHGLNGMMAKSSESVGIASGTQIKVVAIDKDVLVVEPIQ